MPKRELIGKVKIERGRIMLVDPWLVPNNFGTHDVASIEGMRESKKFNLSYSGAYAATPENLSGKLSGSGVDAAAIVCAIIEGVNMADVYAIIEDGNITKLEVEFS